MLVPEIALTPQTARRFEGAFGERVAVLHSGLSERERFEAGTRRPGRGRRRRRRAQRGLRAVAGVRLIAVDEAHERSTSRTACRATTPSTSRASGCGAAGGVVVFGSATPPLEVYARAHGRRDLALSRLARRATRTGAAADARWSTWRPNSSAATGAFSVRRWSTASACGSNGGEKSVLFVNRRGSAGFMLCRNCGSVPECARCSISLTVHRGEGLLRCHLVRCAAADSAALSGLRARTDSRVRRRNAKGRRSCASAFSASPHHADGRRHDDARGRPRASARRIRSARRHSRRHPDGRQGLGLSKGNAGRRRRCRHRTTLAGVSRGRAQLRFAHAGRRPQRSRRSRRGNRADLLAGASRAALRRAPRFRRLRGARARAAPRTRATRRSPR